MGFFFFFLNYQRHVHIGATKKGKGLASVSSHLHKQLRTLEEAWQAGSWRCNGTTCFTQLTMNTYLCNPRTTDNYEKLHIFKVHILPKLLFMPCYLCSITWDPPLSVVFHYTLCLFSFHSSLLQ